MVVSRFVSRLSSQKQAPPKQATQAPLGNWTRQQFLKTAGLGLLGMLLQPPGADAFQVSGTTAKSSHQGENLSRQDFSHQNLKRENFIDTILLDTNFTGSNLSHADFSSTKPLLVGSTTIGNGTRFTQATLNHTKFHGSYFYQADFTGIKGHGMDFQGAYLLRCYFASPSNTEKTVLKDPIFENAQIPGSKFQGTEIIGTGRFRGVSGTYVDFEGATIEKGDFQNAFLIQSTFNLAKLQGIDFTNAILVESLFKGADLQQASFIGADLRHASFGDPEKDQDYPALLQGAKLDGADLRGADIRNIQFDGQASFKGAKYNEETKFPENFGDPQAHGMTFISGGTFLTGKNPVTEGYTRLKESLALARKAGLLDMNHNGLA